MRVLFVAALLLTVVLSGCASTNSEQPDEAPAPATIDPEELDTTGAIINATTNGTTLVFDAVSLPFQKSFKIPAGATMVRFVADPLDAATISVSMKHLDTGRRRCNQQPVVGFTETLTGARSCSSITALDPAGTTWEASASGSGRADARLEFLTRPVDGIAGMLNLSNLSQATHELEPTQYLTIPSFDGTPLWVEVTKPVGEGPWPGVIASSPYNGEANRGSVPAMWGYWTQDWAKRGYVAINVDVRGYGMSGGCVEVWGEREQRDQAFIVDWAASQSWSDGNFGFYGQSYVGTTPVAAAVQNPEALKAIIAVAPVINSYNDWHYGGVPNGEAALSPVAYQVLTAAPGAPEPGRTDMASFLAQATSGVCDPSLLPRANDPRAVYNEFYEERDFSLRAGDITAAVLYTEGFEDANVKSAMIPGWFNEITAPKLGVFGHWLHQHPARMDQEVLFVGWMDHYVKGKDMGFDRIPNAVISAEDDFHRTADVWPPVDEGLILGLDFAADRMVDGAGSGFTMIDLNPIPDSPVAVTNEALVLRYTTDGALPVIAPKLTVSGTLDGENGFVHADLYEVFADGGQRLLTWGRVNLALRNGYDSYEPLAPTMLFEATLPFRPTEHIVASGSTLELRIRGVAAGEAIGTAQPQPAVLNLHGAGSALVVPTVPMSDYTPMPISARP